MLRRTISLLQHNEPCTHQQQQPLGVMGTFKYFMQRFEHKRNIKTHNRLINKGHTCVHFNAHTFPAQLSYCGSYYGGCKFEYSLARRNLNRIPVIFFTLVASSLGIFIWMFFMGALLVGSLLAKDVFPNKIAREYDRDPPVNIEIAEKEAKDYLRAIKIERLEEPRVVEVPIKEVKKEKKSRNDEETE